MAQSHTHVHSYILLDRTGSMSPIWDEALGSVNAYAADIAKGEGDIVPKLTLAVFDAHDGLQFDVLRRSISAENWTDLTSEEASPRGMTPLFDAIARMVALAEQDNPEKAVLVIMTDGAENASREVTRDGVKAALARIEKRDWEVIFLGAEFASFADADAVGIAAGKSMAIGAGRMRASMSSLARKAQEYYSQPGVEMSFDEADREAAGEADVRKRKGTPPNMNR